MIPEVAASHHASTGILGLVGMELEETLYYRTPSNQSIKMMKPLGWNVWVPPKCNLFAWLVSW
jgi:RNase P/RNase MRP subunit p29